MATYDEQVLQEGAERLIKEAADIILRTAVLWGVVTIVIAFVGLGTFEHFSHADTPVPLLAILIAAIATWAGVVEGRRRAFNLRLEAQKIVVLIEVERNTRRKV